MTDDRSSTARHTAGENANRSAVGRHRETLRHYATGGRRWLAVIAAALYLTSGVYVVAVDQQAVVVVAGKARSTPSTPGVHWIWPRPFAHVYKLRTLEARRVTVGYETPELALGRTSASSARFLTGDRNILVARMTVQYAIKDPALYVFGFEDIETLIALTAESELTGAVAETSIDDLLTTGKASAQQAIRERSQARLDTHGCGVSISSVLLETVAPPHQVVDAFNAVASAREDRNRIVRQAQSYANGVVPVARGEAESMRLGAAGHRQRVIEHALGDAARFSAIATEYSKSPDATSSRIYLEIMEEVLPRLEKTLVDAPGAAIDLDLVR